MDKMCYISALTVLAVCLAASLVDALPYGYSMDELSAYDTDECRLCYALEDETACALCITSISETSSDIDKRFDTGLYHPFFRGGYPKKSIYIPMQSPLLRGNYYKKTYVPRGPLHHPILRGGYGGYNPLPRYNPSSTNY